MTTDRDSLKGLTSSEVHDLQLKYGKNELVPQKKESFFKKVLHVICEPMFLLLIIAAVIYFFLNEPRDGAIMLVFVLGMIGIDVMQEWKTDKTLNALKDLSAPTATVIRDGKEQNIHSVDLVPGDIMIICEGEKIPADGKIIKCNDLCVDESSLTGEPEGVWKSCITSDSKDYWRKDYCYAGTLVVQGSAYVLVERIGASTEYGKIGVNIAAVKDAKTPLQKQTGGLVKTCAGIAAVLFALVGVFTYLNIPDHAPKDRIIESILSGITLSMAMIPEEFPVILTVFLSMGAWRLAKKDSLVRRLPGVETLGAVSVLCVDKTGTITTNQMTVQSTWAISVDEGDLVRIMGMGCETNAYDPMEYAMLGYCNLKGFGNEELFGGELISEYPFTNELKMMGHVWAKDEKITIAAKGSPECILKLCDLGESERVCVNDKIAEMAADGLRVIAVAVAHPERKEDVPKKITECKLIFLGLIGLSDPPRDNIMDDVATCKRAGIRVVMITGDNGVTAMAIAKKIGMDVKEPITGEMLNNMSDEELRERVKETTIFSRVIPEHKMRIVKAFKDNGEIVAMTGDGVNDAPALKCADIGIAMGKRGSEVSREAADLILMNDNFTTIVETVKDGRRIYDNIRKAVGYVFTIHIPIAFASLLTPLLGIPPIASFLLPLQVVLLELIIDPTCSIVLERQPPERDIMERKPRNPKEKMLTPSLFIKSVLQGLVIFAASFSTYYIVFDGNEDNAPTARAMGLAIIMLANLLLVQVNSSESDFVFVSVKRLIKDKIMWIVNMGTIVGLVLILYTPLAGLLKLEALSAAEFFISAGIAAVSVLWYEVVKLFKFLKKKKKDKVVISVDK